MSFVKRTVVALLFASAVNVIPSRAAGAEEITAVAEIPAKTGSTLYVSNRAPLAPSPLVKLPVGSITPRGWLAHQLQLQADGMCGHLQEISPWCKFGGNAWTDPKGAGRNGWEEVPYWIRGYGDLGYVLKDKRIIDDTKRWLDAIFAAQAEDGWFGPAGLRTSLNGKPDLWPHMPVLNALQSYYEYSGDARVITLMSRYFKWELACPDSQMFTGYWDKLRTGDNLESVYWLYNRTGDKSLLELAEKLHRHAANWVAGMPNWHNVNVSEGFREPAEYGILARDPKFYAATTHDYDIVMNEYGQVPGGGFAGDENCRPGYTDPRQGFETCGMVEFMHSFEMLTRISGKSIWADRCEEIAFNSFPAAMTADLKALHYLTAPNQIELDKNNKAPGIDNRGTMFSFSPGGVYRCCQHNHGMGWPYFAEEMWNATSDGGLCASLYAPSDVSAKVADGTEVKISEATEYPFNDTIELTVSTGKPVQFPLYLRVPGWCEAAAVSIDATVVKLARENPGYVVINRSWKDGDRVTLKFPMKVTVKTWKKNKDSVSVEYGPLEFSLMIGEKWTKYGGSAAWPEQEVYPTTAWNYGLVLDGANPGQSLEVVKKAGQIASQPFTADTTPITIKARAKKIPEWKPDRNELLRSLQQSPIASTEPTEDVTLIPMGAARLRISSFPVTGTGADAHAWTNPLAPGPAGAARATASHVFEGDTIDALNDGILPKRSSDQTIPRLTFWNHKGTNEWVQYDFKQPTSVSSAEVYWFDDTGIGECRIPKSWRVMYLDGKDWKPVEGTPAYGVERDRLNRAEFTAVKTTALRLEVQLQPNVSGGILEWVVK